MLQSEYANEDIVILVQNSRILRIYCKRHISLDSLDGNVAFTDAESIRVINIGETDV